MADQRLTRGQTLEMLRDSIFNLEEFEIICNQWLELFIPETYQGTRARENISIRNIRHYASENLLDEPLKAGKEARYTYRHLIQVLLIRRATAEGYTSKLLYSILQQDTAQLERLLNGELPSLEKPEKLLNNRYSQVAREQIQTAPASPAQREALDYLESINPRVTRNKMVFESQVFNAEPSKIPSQQWQQFELDAGIELWLRSDAQKPRTELERTRLLELIENILKN